MSEITTAKQNESGGVNSTRRGFLATALAAALGVSLSDLIHPVVSSAALPDCSKSGDAFVPVREFSSSGGALRMTMNVKSTEKNIATIAGEGYQCRSMKVRYYEAYLDSAPAAKVPANPQLPGPGPTMRVKVGDRVHVTLHNQINPALFGKTTPDNASCDIQTVLDPLTGKTEQLYPAKDTPPSCLHGDNITNLHYHGTHVTPDGAGDNVMISVYPAGSANQPQSYVNDFVIPTPPPPSNFTDYSQPFMMGQAPGTHWYHAHKHGSVALQLLNGMAGALIIEGDFDTTLEGHLPGLRASEKVMVIQQLGDNIQVMPGPPTFTCAGGDPLPLVNGQLQPTITMQPGEIQRWRFVNATMQQVAHLTYQFLGEDVYAVTKGGPFPANVGYVPQIRQIAYDGIQLARENYGRAEFGLNQQFTLAPGNRIDILVKAPDNPGKSVLAFQMLHKPPAGCPIRPSLPDLILLRLTVEGTAKPMQFPTVSDFPEMPLWLVWDEKDPRNKIVEQRILNFNSSTVDDSGRPSINGKPFNEKPDTAQYPTLHTAEEWLLLNEWDSSIHPYHIHVNPFQVMQLVDPVTGANIKYDPPYVWRDTIAIPASKTVGAGPPTPGQILIRTRYCDFAGTFVLHCHILDHEDRGMMEEVQIIDPKAKTAPPLPKHH